MCLKHNSYIISIKLKLLNKQREVLLFMKTKMLLIAFLLLQICLVAQENYQAPIQVGKEPVETEKSAEITGKTSVQTQKQNFQPSFESLEKVDPVPEWFKDAKFGIYFHWGVYSVPAFANEWYPRSMYIKGSLENKHHTEIYGDISQWPYHNFITGAKDRQGRFVQFAPKLKSEGGQFDPEEWAQLFADAGAKFAGPVAEHHDGFSMWASKVNPWNAKDMGPKSDLVGLLTDAIRKRNMRIILSMHHAFNITGYYNVVPKTKEPKHQMLYGQQGKEKNESFWLSKHKEIIDNYKPDIVYQDFNLHIISQSVLLEFLSYYYNKAAEWNKEVVATFKDGLNKKCAVLDYERGGPPDITDNYWLTDDAISSSSWCYTEGIGYYSKKQILHSFFDRISKNGNLLLNISPKADGTIPQEQKDILLAMGAWLKKYGEAVYATRAWEKYGEGPTKMGAAHGIMAAPSEGTAKDVRYTRSKDNTNLYAILLGWEKGQKDVVLKSLSSGRIDCENLKSVELINGEAGKYLPLNFKQDNEGLIVTLPERPFGELAYVIKLSFDGKIPSLDKYADLNCTPHYYLVPSDNTGSLVLGSDLTLTGKSKDISNQWKLELAGKGIYKILNREGSKKTFECSTSGHNLVISDFSGKDNQLWKIEEAHNGLFKISNKQFPNMILSVNAALTEGNKAGITNYGTGSFFKWELMEICELKQEAFKPNVIPGTIEAEDFDTGCPGDAYYDRDEYNEGGQYRTNKGVDIEKCAAGGYNVGWTRTGEWTAYTVSVSKSATYQISFYIASASENAKMHLECDGADKTGIISIPNTAGYQNWEVIEKTVKLDAGQHLLKLVVDGDYFNLDKMVFDEIK
jgi:alpha-L-fucosidase